MAKNNNIPPEGNLPIEVEKGVVKHLSVGLYRNYALAIKELISNSYDAGATEVKIKLDLKNRKIIIRDNGRGMDYSEFKEEYLHIGFFKKPAKKPDDQGRLRIGTFGIGFLAPLPYCKTLEIMTKKKGSTKLIRAKIKAENFFSEGTWNIKKETVPYKMTESDLPKNQGETIIVLQDIPPQIIEDLQKEQIKAKAKIDQFSGIDKFKWTLCQYAPILFPPERRELRDFFSYPDRTPMRLWLDGKELFRNVPEGTELLEKAEKKFGNIVIKYTIMTPYSTIKPEEARGLQVRLRDVAVGFPQDFDVTKLGRVLGRLNNLCGEVHIMKGLDNALMVTRDTFNYTSEVAEIYKFFRGKLTEWNNKLYDIGERDKGIYAALPEDKADVIEKDLKQHNIVKFSKERFRLSKSEIVAKKSKEISSPSKKLKEALSKRKDYNIVTSKEKRDKSKSPIRIDSKSKSITIYEEHPSFLESLEVKGTKFLASYDEWDFKKTSYSICRLDSKTKRVIFNSSHPLFKTKVNDRIIKQLALGVVLIVEKETREERLVSEFNNLLERVFQG